MVHMVHHDFSYIIITLRVTIILFLHVKPCKFVDLLLIRG